MSIQRLHQEFRSRKCYLFAYFIFSNCIMKLAFKICIVKFASCNLPCEICFLYFNITKFAFWVVLLVFGWFGWSRSTNTETLQNLLTNFHTNWNMSNPTVTHPEIMKPVTTYWNPLTATETRPNPLKPVWTHWNLSKSTEIHTHPLKPVPTHWNCSRPKPIEQKLSGPTKTYCRRPPKTAEDR